MSNIGATKTSEDVCTIFDGKKGTKKTQNSHIPHVYCAMKLIKNRRPIKI